MLRKISAAVLFLAVSSLVLGQVHKPKQDPNAAALQSLERQYEAALQEYYKPYQSAKTPEESAKIKLDPKKNPNPVYLPKFKSLAMKAGKTKTGFAAWTMVKQIAEQGQDAKTADLADKTILGKFIDTPWIAEYVSALPYSDYSLPPEMRKKKIGATLAKIERASKYPEVKASAIYARAQIIAPEGNGDVATATRLYREILAKYPNTAAGKQAKGQIFEMEHLVVGKVAPDFAAEDQDGTSFKLSDYRGKVVVLDFWGFW